MKVIVADTVEQVLNNAARYFVRTADEAIKTNGRFSVALSGGQSPRKLYELLASPAFSSTVDWEQTDFFFGDERNVPQMHPDSNYLMAKQTLFDPLQIPSSQIFPVDTSLPPAKAAQAYTQIIEKYFSGKAWSFDLVLLGLGENSHTASLFPHTEVLHNKTLSAKEVFLEDQQVYRITLTAPLINQAKHIAFLVYGEGKAAAVHHIIEDERDKEHYPAQLIAPDNGELVWFIDQPASVDLDYEYN